MSKKGMTPPDRYEIRTVSDFFKVPVEKLTPFLADFVQFLAMGHEFPENNVLRFSRAEFTWIDDGQTGLSEIAVEVVEE